MSNRERDSDLVVLTHWSFESCAVFIVILSSIVDVAAVLVIVEDKRDQVFEHQVTEDVLLYILWIQNVDASDQEMVDEMQWSDIREQWIHLIYFGKSQKQPIIISNVHGCAQTQRQT